MIAKAYVGADKRLVFTGEARFMMSNAVSGRPRQDTALFKHSAYLVCVCLPEGCTLVL